MHASNPCAYGYVLAIFWSYVGLAKTQQFVINITYVTHFWSPLVVNDPECGHEYYNFLLDGMCYVYIDDDKHWQKADKKCYKYFGNYATLVKLTPENLEDVIQLVMNANHDHAWTGLYYKAGMYCGPL